MNTPAPPIICDYCDQEATRVEGPTPLCKACAVDHYGAEWRDYTSALGVRARAAIEAERNACQWFATCTRPATTTVAHPILGDVPTCDPCAKFATA
jgi:hypothetical protein